MNIGKIGKFIVISEQDSGHIIRSVEHKDDSSYDVFMPALRSDRQRSKSLKIDQEIEAFPYQNEKGDLVASLLLPKGELNEFVFLEVVGDRDFGSFLDWGLEGDLHVPIKKQNELMKVGEWHLVLICQDKMSGKFYGTAKFGSHLEKLDVYLQPGDKVTAIPVEEMDRGFRCIVNKNFLGMLYYNEVFQEIDQDEPYDAFVKKIRDDGLIDIALQEQGVQNLRDSKDKVLDLLKSSGGSLNLHDKSSPEDIKEALGISKKAFKSAIGMLYKNRKILISKTGIELIEEENSKGKK